MVFTNYCQEHVNVIIFYNICTLANCIQVKLKRFCELVYLSFFFFLTLKMNKLHFRKSKNSKFNKKGDEI